MVTGETSVSSSDRFMWLGYEAVLGRSQPHPGLSGGIAVPFTALCPTNYHLPVTTASVGAILRDVRLCGQGRHDPCYLLLQRKVLMNESDRHATLAHAARHTLN